LNTFPVLSRSSQGSAGSAAVWLTVAAANAAEPGALRSAFHPAVPSFCVQRSAFTVVRITLQAEVLP
jgi:hypothetical protein